MTADALGWVLGPALHKGEVQDEARLRMCLLLHVVDVGRADRIRVQCGQPPRAATVKDDLAVGACGSDRIDPLLAPLARRRLRASRPYGVLHGPHHLVEGELVVHLMSSWVD